MILTYINTDVCDDMSYLCSLGKQFFRFVFVVLSETFTLMPLLVSLEIQILNLNGNT